MTWNFELATKKFCRKAFSLSCLLEYFSMSEPVSRVRFPTVFRWMGAYTGACNGIDSVAMFAPISSIIFFQIFFTVLAVWPISGALPTNAVTSRTQSEIFTAERVTVDAMRFNGGHSSVGIFCRGHGLQMLRIDTSANATQMVKNESIGYWTDQKLIREPMGKSSETHATVPMFVDWSKPKPACSRLEDSSVKLLLQGWLGKHVYSVSGKPVLRE